jgi:hypothetical protein
MADAPALDAYAASHPPLPRLPMNQRAVLSPLNLVLILPTGDMEASALAGLPQDLLHGAWWTTVTASYGISVGSSSVLYGSAIASGTNMTWAQIQSYISTTLASNGAQASPGNTLYLFFFSEGAHFIDASGTIHADAAHAAHFDAADDAYGYVSWGALDDVTWLASHEIVEAATDTPLGSGYAFPYDVHTPPWQQSVWAFSEGHENADMCERLHWVVAGTYEYTRIWSNDAAAADSDPCVPARGSAYYNVGAWQSWVPVAAGQTASIDLVGWANGPVDDWPLTPNVVGDNAEEFHASIVSPTSKTIAGGTLPTIHNGGTAKLTLAVDATAASGHYAVVRIQSDAKLPMSSAWSPSWAVWPVGFYVP